MERTTLLLLYGFMQWWTVAWCAIFNLMSLMSVLLSLSLLTCASPGGFVNYFFL